MLIRWQWAHPGQPIPLVGNLLYAGSDGHITPPAYTTLFTTHGLIMIFFAVTPVLIGAFGHLIVAEAGGGKLAFPRLAPLSFWTLILAQALVLAAFFADLAPGAGWTAYPPLSTTIGSPGQGQTLMILAILVAGASTFMGALNYLVTLLRRPDKSDLSLSAWGQLLTAVLNLLFVPVLAAGSLLLLSDRTAGTHFFTIAGDPILYQHLFWIFGHPEVYVLILPAWGIVGDVLAGASGREPFWRRGTVGAMIAVTVLSGLVYGHHMFQTGFGPLPRIAFETLTLAIGIPSTVIFINWLQTLARGAIRFTVPMLFALGVVVVFALGGLTGIMLGAAATDVHLHDTLWVVGHFHLTMAAATYLASFAAIYLYFPTLFGRPLDATLGVLHATTSFAFLLLTFSGQLVAGWEGQLRRLYDPFQYGFLAHLASLNRWTSWFAFALAASQLFFVVNFFRTLARRR